MHLFQLITTCFVILVTSFSSLLAQTGIPFTDVSAASGLNVVHEDSAGRGLPFGTATVWMDYDRDGDLDLFMSTRSGPNKFFVNQGNATFLEDAQTVKLDFRGDSGGASAADFNNDGWIDLLVTNADSADILYKNINGMYFQNITSSAGFSQTETQKGSSASWGDYDNDGFLDLYIANHKSIYGANSNTDDFLYLNNGNETFTDVTYLLGSFINGYGFIGGWTDYDNDGDLDIFLINDCTSIGGFALNVPTRVFRNDGGTDPLNWNFTEVSAAVGANHCRNGMGLATGDYNRDGWLDYFYTNIGPCILLKNQGGNFTDVTTAAGVGSQQSSIYTWGASFFDYDLDGWLDLYVSAGQLNPPPAIQKNMLYRNDGNGTTFTDISVASNMDDPRKSRSASTADYDGDGDLDIFSVNYGDTCVLYRNDLNNGKHYLIVDLQGTTSNRDGIGSRLKATTPDGLFQIFETRSGSNLGAGDDLAAHFGLDTNTVVTELEIKWPSGTVQRLFNVPVDQRLSVVEPATAPLPIEVINFKAEAVACQALLKWASPAGAANALSITIERSADGEVFEGIGEVAVASSPDWNSYEFLDKDPLPGKAIYRLRANEAGGEFSYSGFIQFQSPCEEALDVTLYPNPTNGRFHIRLDLPQDDHLEVHLYDVMGHPVSILVDNIFPQGRHELAVDQALQNGMYLVKIALGEKMITKKLVVKD